MRASSLVSSLLAVFFLASASQADQAIHDPFASVLPVNGPATEERITGRYVGPGVTCPQFMLDSGETISLSGLDGRDLPEGAEMVLAGQWFLVSTCMQGREFHVERIVSGN